MPSGCARRTRSPARRSSTCRTTSSPIGRGSSSTLNRGADDAVYQTPEQSWGLEVWREPPGHDLVERSLAIHAAYYRMMGALLDDIAASHDRFVLLDVHSYNHRRDGPGRRRRRRRPRRPTSTSAPSRCRASTGRFLLDPLMEAMRGFDFNGRRLDVRENVAFQGKGELTRFVHDRYPRPRLRDRDRVQEILHGRMDRRARPGRAGGDARLHRAHRRARPRELLAMNRALRSQPAPRRPSLPEFGPTGALRQRSATAAASISTARCPSSSCTAATDPESASPGGSPLDQPRLSVWSPDDDAAAADGARSGRSPAMRERFGRILLIVARRPAASSTRAEGCAGAAAVLAPDRRAATTATPAGRADALGRRRCARSRSTCAAARSSDAGRADAAEPSVERWPNGIDGVDRLSLGLPQIHDARTGRHLSAALPRAVVALVDALLEAACAFIDDGRPSAPRHYRALGRSAFIAAALKADRKLDRIAAASISCCRLADQHRQGVCTQFRRRQARKSRPHFRYRPLTVDPDDAKRELYAIDLARARRSGARAAAVREKRHELDHQLTMLATRNTPAFRSASHDALRRGRAPTCSTTRGRSSPRPRRSAGRAGEHRSAPRSRRRRARAGRALPARRPAFDADSRGARRRRRHDGLRPQAVDLDATPDAGDAGSMPLLAHEVGVHLLTYFNGAAQGLTIFRRPRRL